MSLTILFIWFGHFFSEQYPKFKFVRFNYNVLFCIKRYNHHLNKIKRPIKYIMVFLLHLQSPKAFVEYPPESNPGTTSKCIVSHLEVVFLHVKQFWNKCYFKIWTKVFQYFPDIFSVSFNPVCVCCLKSLFDDIFLYWKPL